MGPDGCAVRRRRRPVGLTLAATVLGVMGCAEREPAGPDAEDPPSPIRSTTPAPPTSTLSIPSTPSPRPATGVPRLRLDDHGTHLTMQVERTAVILLPARSWTWTDPTVDGPAVTVSEDISDASATSRSWTVTARTPGTATVSTVGTPTCRATTPPCAAPDLRWEVRVTVP